MIILFGVIVLGFRRWRHKHHNEFKQDVLLGWFNCHKSANYSGREVNFRDAYGDGGKDDHLGSGLANKLLDSRIKGRFIKESQKRRIVVLRKPNVLYPKHPTALGPANDTNVIRSEAVETAFPVAPNDTSQHLQASVPPSRQFANLRVLRHPSSPDPLTFSFPTTSSPANSISAHSCIATYTLREARTLQAQKFDKGPCTTESKAEQSFHMKFCF
ncbi:unnamed protein product [Protopolystoma xenopodis]|uniref:Uncharacterized protein n=1 Tax=Protopolystoma xenopodis TaxID=117903 RepID=A0A448XAE3_9PLAT|nr:unnamed protein product [Protopolystoma xenopodis]